MINQECTEIQFSFNAIGINRNSLNSAQKVWGRIRKPDHNLSPDHAYFNNINMTPFQVFSFWNGAVVFCAKPIMNKTIAFRRHANGECVMMPETTTFL
jgi:Cryptococcal mannosyltransferase 1